MATPRSDGASRVTSRVPIRMAPPEIPSSPAIARSSVDLPQPEGPTKTQNSPSETSSETPCSAWTSP